MQWRWPWQRRRPLMLYSIDQALGLARETDDPVKRGEYLDLIRDQSAVLHDAAGDGAMRAVIAMEDRMGARLQEALGPVYDLIAEGVSHARGAKEGVGVLHGKITAMEGTFSAFGERLDDLENGQGQIKAQLHAEVGKIRTEMGGQLADALQKLEESRRHRADLEERVARLERERGGDA